MVEIRSLCQEEQCHGRCANGREWFTLFYIGWMRCEKQVQGFVLSRREINHLFQTVICHYVKEGLADSCWILGTISPHGLPVDV